MKTWIRNHISDLKEEVNLINNEVTRLIKKRSLLKRKIKMFNRVMNNTDDTE
jgi:beta-N-acetylglucosaminidase